TGAVLLFDARAPGRWRDVLATPALLAFDVPVLVYPDPRFVERMIHAGTPIYMLSGGWEADHQRWPDAARGPWHTEVVARGRYHAPRAEVAFGAAPAALVDHGGPWELQRFDPSIFRAHGAWSLYPGSRFLSADAGGLASDALAMRWQPGARLELHGDGFARCEITASLERGGRALALTPMASASDQLRMWTLPAGEGARAEVSTVRVRWRCPAPPQWRRLSMRWER
ncbi:MAG: hypothetical protein KC636_29400, partial [Myxococcales bacterium]|nr:hypothetical protein [Myxococcales bacterium]